MSFTRGASPFAALAATNHATSVGIRFPSGGGGGCTTRPRPPTAAAAVLERAAAIRDATDHPTREDPPRNRFAARRAALRSRKTRARSWRAETKTTLPRPREVIMVMEWHYRDGVVWSQRVVTWSCRAPLSYRHFGGARARRSALSGESLQQRRSLATVESDPELKVTRSSHCALHGRWCAQRVRCGYYWLHARVTRSTGSSNASAPTIFNVLERRAPMLVAQQIQQPRRVALCSRPRPTSRTKQSYQRATVSAIR